MTDLSRLDSYVFEKLSRTHLPGLSAVAVKDGEMIYCRGFGLRDTEYGLRAGPDTLYGIGSVTKSFTALSIMQLVEKGKLDVDDSVSKYTPLDLRSKQEPIKVWHLLSHSSGIPALAYAEAFIRYVTGAGDKWVPMGSRQDVFTFMDEAEEWAWTNPGERWFYLNEGYLILGHIIDKLSGMSYEDYVKKNILNPLKMNRSYFKKEEVEADGDIATPYVVTRDGEQKRSVHPYGISSDGGLISNVRDLSRYITMYLDRGRCEEGRLLSAELIEEMEKPRVTQPTQMFGGESYGYGLGVNPNFLGHRLLSHGGSVLVSTAYIGYIPEKRIGIALLANGSGYPLSQIGMYGLALMLGEDPEALPFIKVERNLEKLTGVYETYKGTMKARVSARGGILLIEIKDRYVDTIIPLVPEALEGDSKSFHAIQPAARLPVEFLVKGDKIDLIYERYRLKRVSDLSAK